MIDEELRFAGPDGRIVGKADDLLAHREGIVSVEALEVLNRQFVVDGDVAVALVTAQANGNADGEVFDSRLMYTRCWVRRATGWRVLGGSVLPLG